MAQALDECAKKNWQKYKRQEQDSKPQPLSLQTHSTIKVNLRLSC